MSQIVLSSLVLILSQVLPMLGVEVGSEQLTNTIQTIIAIVAGLYIWYRRVRRGDVNAVGGRK